jgi:hypothetical protein
MVTKKCCECGVEKEIKDFYEHPTSFDGYATKCKMCAKQYSIARYKARKINPGMIEIMKKRKEAAPKTLQEKEYKGLFPEKYKARNATQRMKADRGYCNHHWSYLRSHWTDVIHMSLSDHAFIHAHTIYDQERMQYRGLNNILLDTKEKYLEYYELMKSLHGIK